MSRHHCPDAVYGQHGPVTRNGNCPWCGEHIPEHSPDIPHDERLVERALAARPASGFDVDGEPLFDST